MQSQLPIYVKTGKCGEWVSCNNSKSINAKALHLSFEPQTQAGNWGLVTQVLTFQMPKAQLKLSLANEGEKSIAC